MATSIENPDWAVWLSSVLEEGRPNSATTMPFDRFYCVLDDLPLHLIPKYARFPCCPSNDTELFLSRNCILLSGGNVPPDLAISANTFSTFPLKGTIAWVQSQKRGWLPFWLGPRLEKAVRSVRPGVPVPPDFPASDRDLLVAAGILVPGTSNSIRENDSSVNDSRARFFRSGYAPLSGLIHPFHVAALRRYSRQLIRTGAIRLGDKQSPRRYAAYNEPVAQFFHRQITPLFSSVAGEPLKPSYVYLASYLSGAELKKHTDREQCEFSITVCLDFSPEPDLETPWPICLETSSGTVAVHQALGDGLAYRGTRLPHFRRALDEGFTSTSIFFHYVPESFEGSLD